MKRILAVLAIVLLTGCASVGRDRAVQAHQADIGSTVVGLALGAAEGNPLGLLALPIKAWQMHEISKEPEATVRAEAYLKVAAAAEGAAANNVCVAVALAVPALLPMAVACPLVGIGWAVREWNPSPEVFYAAFCEEWRREREGNTCSPYVAP
jgi:hypothetical protein